MNWAKTSIILEKSHYPFKRYPKTPCDTVLFPGCSFPSQFPKTMDRLACICEEHGVGVAFDCCGVPLLDCGRMQRAACISQGIERHLAKCGCKRLAVMCPNCLNHLKSNLDIQVITVFDMLADLGIEALEPFEEGMLYVPCPDRVSRTMEQSLRAAYDLDCLRIHSKGCCGLRPDIALKGPDVSAKCGQALIKAAKGERVYTYCASCAGQLARLGELNVRHVVSVILGIDEEPDASRAFMNRAKCRFTGGRIRS